MFKRSMQEQKYYVNGNVSKRHISKDKSASVTV